MSTPTHTPGPWVVKSTDEDINTKTIIDSDEFWIAKVLNFNRASDDIRESQANANLLAAAPAMYEALREAQELIRSLVAEEMIHSSELQRVGNCQANMWQALSQAEGRHHG